MVHGQQKKTINECEKNENFWLLIVESEKNLKVNMFHFTENQLPILGPKFKATAPKGEFAMCQQKKKFHNFIRICIPNKHFRLIEL